MIHALGKHRLLCARALPKADIIITTNNQAAERYGAWIVSQNYWLYDDLFKQWTPITSSPNTIVWRRLPQPRASQFIDSWISGPNVITINAPHRGFYRIELNYVAEDWGKHLFLLENNYLLPLGVSLDTKSHKVVVPVYAECAGERRYHLNVHGVGEYKMKLLEVSCQTIEFVDENVLHVSESSDPNPG